MTLNNSSILIGAAARADKLAEAEYTATLAREFSLLTPENELKMKPIHPGPDTYNFGPADALVDFATAHQMKVRGHTLVWDIETPPWIIDPALTVPQIMAAFESHIRTIVGRYSGRIVAWDVANEMLEPSPSSGLLRQSFVKRLGSEGAVKDLLVGAFLWAHAADPNCRLFLSDSSIESAATAKGQAFLALVKELVARGAPIDGVGLHAHLKLEEMTALGAHVWKPALAAAAKRYNDIGLEFQITELDVSMALPRTLAKDQDQAAVYRDVLDVVLQIGNSALLNMWGITDKYSWIPGFSPGRGAALIFDEHYAPKPAYTAILMRL